MTRNFEPEDLIQQAKLTEIKKRRRTVIVTLSLILFLLGYLVYTVSTLKKNDIEKNAVLTINDSLINRIAQIDSAKETIFSYFESQNKSDTLGVLNLLADTVLRYYMIANPINKSKLKTNRYFVINQNGKYIIDSSFNVSKIKDTLYALIKTPVYGGNEIWYRLHEIKMNTSYKIFYVRAYKINSEEAKDKFGVE